MVGSVGPQSFEMETTDQLASRISDNSLKRKMAQVQCKLEGFSEMRSWKVNHKIFFINSLNVIYECHCMSSNVDL